MTLTPPPPSTPGQIGEGFLTFLGPDFLRRLYRRVALVPGSFLLVVEEPGNTVGFLAGSTDVAASTEPSCGVTGAATAFACRGRLLRSWRRVMETLRHGTGGTGEGAELLAIAVDPAARGRGVGTLLVEGFLAEIGRRRQHAAHVVVAADNETAVALYGRAGFHTVERFELHRRHRVPPHAVVAFVRQRAVKMEVLLVAVVALVVTAALAPVCIVVARRWDIMDRPGPLKTQEVPVPYLGGVAVFAGVAVGVCVGRPIALVPMAAALAVGVSDDRFGLPATARLAGATGRRSRHRRDPAGPPARLGSVCLSSWRPPSS